ncbi:uncharacterized protein [Miscanthus floridulus]|uniref:uncharacterized protein n=1 Tax=Miscanthus floridulus TaxID=154761 RepID=UPI0034579521
MLGAEVSSAAAVHHALVDDAGRHNATPQAPPDRPLLRHALRQIIVGHQTGAGADGNRKICIFRLLRLRRLEWQHDGHLGEVSQLKMMHRGRRQTWKRGDDEGEHGSLPPERWVRLRGCHEGSL